jgi:hypothetical protein
MKKGDILIHKKSKKQYKIDFIDVYNVYYIGKRIIKGYFIHEFVYSEKGVKEHFYTQSEYRIYKIKNYLKIEKYE